MEAKSEMEHRGEGASRKHMYLLDSPKPLPSRPEQPVRDLLFLKIRTKRRGRGKVFCALGVIVMQAWCAIVSSAAVDLL